MKKLKPLPVDWAQIERFLASAERKLASARKIPASKVEGRKVAASRPCPKERSVQVLSP